MRFTVRICCRPGLAAIFPLMAMLLASPAAAQTVNASLSGTVTDATGAVVPHATVIATGIDTGVATKTTTNQSGDYAFPSLQAATIAYRPR